MKLNILTSKKIHAIISRLETSSDLSYFYDFHYWDRENPDIYVQNPKLFGYISDSYNSGSEGQRDVMNANKTVLLAMKISSAFGIKLDTMTDSDSITNDEKMTIIELSAFDIGLEGLIGSDKFEDNDQMTILNPSSSAFGETKAMPDRQISLNNYITGYIFLLMAKEIRNTKEFFFKNNSETQLVESQRLEAIIAEKDCEIASLEAEISKVGEHIKLLKDEITMLKEELSKENKNAIKPYAAEISVLNGTIRKLERALESEKGKDSELYALREFVFAIQSEDMPSKTIVPLAELVNGKKIIVVGGHINWRNNMKEKYPTIRFLDGHNVSIDVSILDNSDFILLSTGNMSHKLYLKIIGYLRDKKIKFNYLGKSKNQELWEAEISSILEAKM